MKKRKGLIFSLLICLSAITSVAFSDYLIWGTAINGNQNDTIIVNGENDNNYKKVSFTPLSSSGLSPFYIYVKNNDYLTLNDIPSEYVDALIEWKTSDNRINLSPINNGFSTGIKITSDLNLEAKQINVSTVNNPTSDEIKRDENNKDQDGNINVNGNTVRIEEGSNNRDTTTEINITKPIFNGSVIETTFKDQDGNESTSQNLKKVGDGDTTSYQHTMDQTIGLEDPATKADFYKPNAGKINSNIGQNNINNCVTRLKLQNDTVLSNTNMTIGARVGYCRWGSNSSQTNFQGFIVGSYNELDLCGKTLYVTSGSTLDLIGSLIDSVGGGKVIVQNGGVLKATFVMEDAHHETSIPASYSLGDAPFKMYRSPYLNATIKLEKGSRFIGHFNMDMGSDDNTNMHIQDLNIIGDNDSYIFNTSGCSNNSYILREPVWDENLINATINEAGTKRDIAYQKFKYTLQNCDSLSINTPTFNEIAYTGYSFEITWDRSDFIIPNYFQFYLYNSTVTIKNNFIFMPGTYLYADEHSEIILSAKNYGEYDKSFDIGDVALPSEIKINDYYQAVGGLLFVHEKYNYAEIQKYYKAEDSSRLRIFENTINFRSYLNKNYSAYADIYGKISFDTSKALYKELYHIGGEINIFDLGLFINNVNAASNFVELYNSGFYGGPCHFNPITNKNTYFNVSDYFCYPLISENNVLTSMDSGLGIVGIRNDCTTNKMQFDFHSGVITGNNKSYIPIFMDKNGTYNNWCNHINKTRYTPRHWSFEDFGYVGIEFDEWVTTNDDSRIVFNECTYDPNNNIATVNNENYIYFRGGFFKYNGSQVDIYKFRNFASNEAGNTNSYKDVVLNKNDTFYGHAARRLK